MSTKICRIFKISAVLLNPDINVTHCWINQIWHFRVNNPCIGSLPGNDMVREVEAFLQCVDVKHDNLSWTSCGQWHAGQ